MFDTAGCGLAFAAFGSTNLLANEAHFLVVKDSFATKITKRLNSKLELISRTELADEVGAVDIEVL